MDCHILLQGIFPTQGLNPGIEPGYPVLQASLPSEPPGRKPVQQTPNKNFIIISLGQLLPWEKLHSVLGNLTIRGPSFSWGALASFSDYEEGSLGARYKQLILLLESVCCSPPLPLTSGSLTSRLLSEEKLISLSFWPLLCCIFFHFYQGPHGYWDMLSGSFSQHPPSPRRWLK